MLISLTVLFEIARDLQSEDGENPEYDRALHELLCQASGRSMDDVPEIARQLRRRVPA